MAHLTQMFFINNVRTFFPAFFNGKKVLEIGSLNVNGTVRIFFENCDYLGIDVGTGPGVDRVCAGQDFPGKAQEFDVIVSTEVFEHTEQWDAIFLNMLRMLKRDGLLTFTCASHGREQHGTSLFDAAASPLTSGKIDYYHNLIEDDFINAFQLNYWFSSYAMYRDQTCLYFVGLGMKETANGQAMNNFKRVYNDYLYKKNVLGLPHDYIIAMQNKDQK
jgi:hypothetical protein